MKFEATPTEIQQARAALAAVRDALDALREFDHAGKVADVDCARFQTAAARRAAAFDPRRDADVRQYADDRARESMWQLWFRSRPAQRERLAEKLCVALRACVDAGYECADYFEEAFCSGESLLPMLCVANAETVAPNVLATIEGVLSRRLPQHPEVIRRAGPVDPIWRQRTYSRLLAAATREPAPAPEQEKAA